MADKIRLVQGDTRPQLRLFLKDQSTGTPINLAGAEVRLVFRRVGDDAPKEVLVCNPAPGTVDAAGRVVFGEPYLTFGSGGRAICDWTPTALDEAGEFEGEVEITFGDGGIQTVEQLLNFTVRPQFAQS